MPRFVGLSPMPCGGLRPEPPRHVAFSLNAALIFMRLRVRAAVRLCAVTTPSLRAQRSSHIHEPSALSAHVLPSRSHFPPASPLRRHDFCWRRGRAAERGAAAAGAGRTHGIHVRGGSWPSPVGFPFVVVVESRRRGLELQPSPSKS